MANILSSIFTPATVAITNKTTGQILGSSIKVKSAKITYGNLLFKHTVENGQTIVDYKIKQPTTIEFELFAPNLSVYGQINAIFSSPDDLFEITSKSIVLKNMRADMERVVQSAEVLSSIPVKLSFKEVLDNGSESKVAEQSADYDTLAFGIQLPKTATSSTLSLFGG